MDKKIQLFFIIFLLGISIYAQNPNPCKEIQVDSTEECTKVSMGLETFTKFYQAEKNLSILRDQLPNIKTKVDSLRKINKKLEENYLSQIKGYKKIDSIRSESIEECIELSTDLSIDNEYLRYKNKRLQKRQPYLVGGGSVATIILYGLIKIFIL